MRKRRLELRRRGRRRPGDEEQRPGLGGVEAGEVGAPAAGQPPPAVAALDRVHRDPGHAEGVEVAAGGALGDLQLLGHLGGGDLAALLQEQEDGHQPIGADGAILAPETGHR